MLEKFLPFLIAAGLGLIIGIERERRHMKGEQPLGVRTFILLGLLGALAGWVSEPLIALSITLFAGAAILLGYLQSTKSLANGESENIGLTTEIAAGTTFGIGYLAHHEPLLSVAIGTLVLLVLLSRSGLHRFSRDTIKPNEVQASATIFVIAFVILPLLPDHALDPWGAINLHTFGLIVVIIAGIEFAGYVAVRMFGSTAGLPIFGMMSGLISSTAVYLTMPKLVKKDPRLTRAAAAGALLAAVSSLALIIVIVASLAPELVFEVFVAVGSAVVAGGAVATLLTLKGSKEAEFSPPTSNPLSLWGAIRLAALLVAILGFVAVARRHFGEAGVHGVSFLSGLADVHATTLAMVHAFKENHISRDIAAETIVIAAISSTTFKLVILGVLSRGRYLALAFSATLTMLLLLVALWIAQFYIW